MSRINLRITALLFFTCLTQVISAQLTEENLKGYTEIVKEKVLGFTSALEKLANSDSKFHQVYIDQALGRFIPGSRIETSSKGSSNIKSHDIEKYLKETVSSYNGKYRVVVLEVLSVRFDKWKEKKDSDGNAFYELSYKYTQTFKAAKEIKKFDPEGIPIIDEWHYSDTTKKKGKVILKKRTGASGSKWEILLSDIKVEETY